MDHGTLWWNTSSAGGWTQLTVWLMKQGLRLHLSGISQRFHGALEKARRPRGLPEPILRQRWLNDFRLDYNHVRPHEALGMQTPASLRHPSPKPSIPMPRPGNTPRAPRSTA